MAVCEEVGQAVIHSCRVIPSSAETEGALGAETYGIQLHYSDDTSLFIPDVSSRFEEAEELAARLCGQDVGPDMVPYIVYDFLCAAY